MTTSEEEKLARITNLTRYVRNADRVAFEAKEIEEAEEELFWESLDYITFLLDIVHGGTNWRQP